MTPGGSKRSQINTMLSGVASTKGEPNLSTLIVSARLVLVCINRKLCVVHVHASLVSTGRASDRHAHLDGELKGLQLSLRELETFLKWLQEAETTVNVLADASQREDLTQDTAHVKELRRQLEVRAVEIICVSLDKRIISLLAFRNTLAHFLPKHGRCVGLHSCIICRSEVLCHCLCVCQV